MANSLNTHAIGYWWLLYQELNLGHLQIYALQMEYLECKQESLSMWDQDMWVVYKEQFVSYTPGG